MSNKDQNIDLLEPKNMTLLYARGAFPMAEQTGRINWYMPEIRTIIPLKEFNIPRTLKKFMKETEFTYTYDKATIDVVKNCADRTNTWINERLIKAYEGMQKLGHLHSVEVYKRTKLVGGLYGVTFRGAFFGESMFQKESQASKAALVKLVERLNQRGFKVLDVQYYTDHLGMFGAKEITFDEYADLLREAYRWEISFN